MKRLDDHAFEVLGDEIDFCVENVHAPGARVAELGRFYEDAAEALRAHAILRLLVDANPDGFSTDLVASGQSRRGFLRRCARERYVDYFCALSRSGSMLDAIAANDLALAAELFSLSPAEWRKGDEYEDDFAWQRFLGLHVSGAPAAETEAALERLARATEGDGARLAVARALHARDAEAFEEAFLALLREREAENEEDAGRADEEVAVAVGTKVFVEGVAVLKLARRAGIPIAREYRMCPWMALEDRPPATPPDEFSPPA